MTTIALPEIQFLPVIAAAIVAFLFGGVWYHDKLFGAPYRAIFHQEKRPPSTMIPAMIIQFAYNLLTAALLWLISPSPTLVVLFIVLVFLGTVAGILFQAKPPKAAFIVAGNQTIAIVIMIIVMSAFRSL